MSLKTASSLSKTAQTWRKKPANSSDMTRFSGKSLRLGEKIRLHKSAHETNLGFKSHVTKGPPEKCKESVFWIQILCRNQLRLKKWCKAISLLPSSLHYATSLQALKSLSITCKRWSIVSCVHDSLLGHSSKRRERLSMKCVATNHSSF